MLKENIYKINQTIKSMNKNMFEHKYLTFEDLLKEGLPGKNADIVIQVNFQKAPGEDVAPYIFVKPAPFHQGAFKILDLDDKSNREWANKQVDRFVREYKPLAGRVWQNWCFA